MQSWVTETHGTAWEGRSVMKPSHCLWVKQRNTSVFLMYGEAARQAPALTVQALCAGAIPKAEFITFREQRHRGFITSVFQYQKAKQSLEIWCSLQENIKAAIW